MNGLHIPKNKITGVRKGWFIKFETYVFFEFVESKNEGGLLAKSQEGSTIDFMLISRKLFIHFSCLTRLKYIDNN